MTTAPPQRRIYPLDNPDLTEEQIAVVFAMTSRSPDPFDEIAQHVSVEKSAQFHEKYVLDYGHASVAEHAVLHLAVENISRLACDTIEDNRLASYTEKSSRYQVIERNMYHRPEELNPHPDLALRYQKTCQRLFDSYHHLVQTTIQHLKNVNPRAEMEAETAYALRLRRIATDSCRSLLPASTLTNVGITANARTMEHAITKLLSAPLQEERQIGQDLLEKARAVTPTLIKYAANSPYLEKLAGRHNPTEKQPDLTSAGARVLEFDPEAEAKIGAALAYRHTSRDYRELLEEDNAHLVKKTLQALDRHDTPPREFENVSYLFEFTLDYGAYREFKRHRIQTSLTKTPDPKHGYTLPPLIDQADCKDHFERAIAHAEETYKFIEEKHPLAAPYILTHAHHRKVLATMNLRELYHILKLRTSPQAHEAIRGPMKEALTQLKEIHPTLFAHL